VACVSQAVFLIFVSGGFRAPGVFWISMIPFLGGVAFGRKGVLVGILMTIITLLLFTFVESQGELFKKFEENNKLFLFEKQLNLYLYTIATMIATFYHVVTSENYQDKLKGEKNENENLLRVLFHDLANPIQIIKYQIKKIYRLKEKTEIDTEAQKIELTIQKMIDQLEHVKKLKALKDGKKSIELEKVSLIFAFLKVQETLARELEKKEVVLSINTQKENDEVVYADQMALIYQVFSNIISNATKFSEEKGVIEVHWRKVNDSVEVEIRDHGIGMPKDIMENLFSDHIPTSRKGTNGESGTGYGMPIVKNFMDLFQAKILIRSIEKKQNSRDHGTTFILVFPLNGKK
jgi:signal transduction histidine kinase